MMIAGAWSWRILALAGVAVLFVYLVIQLRLIVIPLLVALLLAALLVPLVQLLRRHGWPKWLAVAVAELGLIGVVTGLVFLLVWQVRTGLPELQVQSVTAWENFKQFLLESPLHLTNDQINAYGDQFWASVQRDSEVWISGALSVGSTAGHVLAGVLLVLFITLFMLIDGGRIWAWIVRLFPRRARPALSGSGEAGWRTLTQFVKVQIFVARWTRSASASARSSSAFPLVDPGRRAGLPRLVHPDRRRRRHRRARGLPRARLQRPVHRRSSCSHRAVVQQLEGHVLQPLVMGIAVKVHPLAVVLVVAAGAMIAGIPGALFAVPFVATSTSSSCTSARGSLARPDRPGVQTTVIATARDGTACPMNADPSRSWPGPPWPNSRTRA